MSPKKKRKERRVYFTPTKKKKDKLAGNLAWKTRVWSSEGGKGSWGEHLLTD
jgi:hypothetical protein